MTFKVGDKIRRCSKAVHGSPIGFETVVIEPQLGTGHGRVWYTDKYGIEVHGDAGAFELIQDGPVRTETVRRLGPGVYGRLWIDEDCDGYVTVALVPKFPEEGWSPSMAEQRSFSAPELRELARVAHEIAEYLEDA